MDLTGRLHRCADLCAITMAVSSLFFPLDKNPRQRHNPLYLCLRFILEVTPGFEPGVRVLQTLALPLGYVTVDSYYYMRSTQKSPVKPQNILREPECPHSCVGIQIWSGQRGSNSLPPPWQGGALPDELCPQMVPSIGIEPMTRGFSVLCSTN